MSTKSLARALAGRRLPQPLGAVIRACGGRAEGGEPIADAAASATAAQVLRHYSRQRQSLQLGEAAELFTRLEHLHPSVHDERLRSLIGDIVARRADLPLGTLVDVARVSQRLGLHKEMMSLTELVMDSTSFLPSDVVLSFARTLAVATQKAAPTSDPASAQASAAVFRILGEHVQEAMFDAAPEELAEALLALGVFHCSKAGGAPDPILSRPRHLEVFASAAGLLLGGRAAAAPASALAKCLRAYKLLLLGGPAPAAARRTAGTAGPASAAASAGALGAGAASEQGLRAEAALPASAAGIGAAGAELVPPALAEALAPRLPELPLRDVVRCLHATASLHARGAVPLEPRSLAFCKKALEQLRERSDELSIKDLAFALQALAELAPPRGSVPVRAKLLRQLYEEVQHHVPTMTLDDAFKILRAADKLVNIARPGVVTHLLAAEVSRELRHLKPQQLCDAAASFCRLGFEEEAFMRSLSDTFTSKLQEMSPKQMALTLHAFSKAGVHNDKMYNEAAPCIVRDLIGYSDQYAVMCLWSFAKVQNRHTALFSKLEQHFKLTGVSRLGPQDISMLLWSFGRVEWVVDEALVSDLAHHVAHNCSAFPQVSQLVTCLSFTRLGFARQPVLVELYRSLYARLPALSDSQLAFSFFLFSTSGVRDAPLQRRFLYETAQRVERLRGQDLSNVMLACARTTSPAVLAETHDLGDSLKHRVFDQLEEMKPAPLLGCYMSLPQLFTLSEEEKLEVMDALSVHLPEMEAAELSRALFATARAEVVHKPFLLPLFHFLRQNREHLTASETVSCIWSVYVLGFCKPKFQRTLSYVLLQHVKQRRLPARALRDALPALNHLGMWERLPPSLRRSVWHLASEDLRRCVAPPPPKAATPGPELKKGRHQQVLHAWPPEGWRLPALRPGLIREHMEKQRPGGRRQPRDNLAASKREEEIKERAEAKELATDQVPADGRKAVADFVGLIQRL